MADVVERLREREMPNVTAFDRSLAEWRKLGEEAAREIETLRARLSQAGAGGIWPNGIKISFSEAEYGVGNAVISPDDDSDGPYWTLIGGGSNEEQNRIAAFIVEAVNRFATLSTPPAPSASVEGVATIIYDAMGYERRGAPVDIDGKPYGSWKVACDAAAAVLASLPPATPVSAPTPAGGVREALDVPLGAIENGRAFADRLETTGLECPAGDLRMCSDWQEFRRCFDFLAEWAISVPARAAIERLDASLAGAAEAIPATPQNALIKALTVCRATLPHMGGSAMATDSLLREIDAALSSPATPVSKPSPSAGEPVAYLQTNGDARVLVDASRRLDDDDRALGWTETPLYATPPAPSGEVVLAARGIVSAWEALPGDGYYGLRIVQEWLVDRMKPAMDNLRAALSNPAPGHGEAGL